MLIYHMASSLREEGSFLAYLARSGTSPATPLRYVAGSCLRCRSPPIALRYLLCVFPYLPFPFLLYLLASLRPQTSLALGVRDTLQVKLPYC